MLTLATWLLAAAVAAGLALAGFWLKERRPIPLLAPSHGLLAALGTGLVAATVAGGAPDPQNFGHLTAWFLAAALLGGGLVVLARLRRRRPSGLVVALHASIGVAGFVLLLAYGALPR